MRRDQLISVLQVIMMEWDAPVQIVLSFTITSSLYCQLIFKTILTLQLVSEEV